jgi:hypothetical protein
MSIFPVAPDNSAFPVPSQNMLHPIPKSGSAMQIQPIESMPSLAKNYSRNDTHGILLSHPQSGRTRKRANMQQHNTLDNWTNDLMGRSRR